MPKNKPDYIPNIYQFCDRWCARCAFTTNCEAFVAAEKITDDETNRVFWEKLEQQLPATEKWLIGVANQKGVSLTEFDVPLQKKNFDLFQRDAKSNAVLKAGRLYEDLVDEWFDNSIEQFGLKTIETDQGAAIKMPEGKNSSTTSETNALFEVILRYQLQLYLKISRCFYSRGKEAENEESEVEIKDSIGTAKSTLVLLDRSMAAWKLVQNTLPESVESILEILVLLQRLRHNIELEFQDARKFVRPGFDEG
jgi:hypothetical protein